MEIFERATDCLRFYRLGLNTNCELRENAVVVLTSTELLGVFLRFNERVFPDLQGVGTTLMALGAVSSAFLAVELTRSRIDRVNLELPENGFLSVASFRGKLPSFVHWNDGQGNKVYHLVQTQRVNPELTKGLAEEAQSNYRDCLESEFLRAYTLGDPSDETTEPKIEPSFAIAWKIARLAEPTSLTQAQADFRDFSCFSRIRKLAGKKGEDKTIFWYGSGPSLLELPARPVRQEVQQVLSAARVVGGLLWQKTT